MDGPISILSGTCVHRRERAMTNSRHLGQTEEKEDEDSPDRKSNAWPSGGGQYVGHAFTFRERTIVH